MDSIVGPPSYGDVAPIASAYIKAAPQRVVWGSDWPHTTATDSVDDAALVDVLARWAPDIGTQHGTL